MIHAMSRTSVQIEATKKSAAGAPRLIMVDDNIRDQGGHYFELAYLLMSGAERLGYDCILGTHREFNRSKIAGRDWKLHRVFNTRRMIRWSLGVDGRSRCQRDLFGRPVAESPFVKLAQRAMDRLGPEANRPDRMLQQWSDDLYRLLADIQPNASDSLLVNTGDDFTLLALAHAMQRSYLPPMRIDVLFHFAVYQSGQPDHEFRIRLMGQQIRSALNALHPHDVHLHATTDPLADQLRELKTGVPIRSIPYPTRPYQAAIGSSCNPLTAVIAGMPRSEKGKDFIPSFLLSINESLLKTGRYRLSIQLPADRWRSIVPTSLHRYSKTAMPGQAVHPLEIITCNLTTHAYHQWLSSADVGVFLYQPNRYSARCSGVLLEMLARGLPVIVPDHCWLADQVRLAGGDGSIGFIYQNRNQIPELMRKFADRCDEIRERALNYAAAISERHVGHQSLLAMGLQPVGRNRQLFTSP